MKKTLLTFIIIATALTGFAQVAINMDGSSPNSNAMLDVKSSNKGMLIPRMSTTERTTLGNNLNAADKGMLVFDTDKNNLFYWAENLWIEISPQNYWKTIGNTVALRDTNFIGTINNMPLNIFTDSTLHVRITTKGQIETMNTGGSIFIGKGAGNNDITTDTYTSVYIGDSAGFLGSGFARDNIAIGKKALYGSTGGKNIAIGNNTLMYSSHSARNIAIGFEAIKNLNNTHTADWYDNIAIGTQALYTFDPNSNYSPGRTNTAIGSYSMYSLTQDGNNTALGAYTLYENTSGYDNVALGAGAISGDPVSIGNIAIGKNAIGDGDHTITDIAIGIEALYQASGDHNIAIGLQSLYNTTADDNLAVGEYSLHENTEGVYNIGIGKSTLNNNLYGDANVALGYEAGLATLGNGNIFIGFQAGKNETGSNKLYIENSLSSFPLIGGDFAANTVDVNGTLTASSMVTNGTIKIEGGTPGLNKFLVSDAAGLGSWHTPEVNDLSDGSSDGSSLFLGNSAGSNDGGTTYNTAVGLSSLTTNTSGTNNTAFGFQAGYLSTGNANVFIGYKSGYNETGNNKLYIANSNTATPLIGGDFSTSEVDINGSIKITGGSPGANKVLTSDANGLASWQATQGAQAINDLSDAKTTLSSCVFLGSGSGSSITSGTGNSAVGVEALNATLNGSQNTAQGYRALYHNTSGAHNTVVGFNAFNTNTSGNDNTALGYYAGFLATGTGNVFLGYNAGYNETGSNKLYIANSNTSTPLIGGDFSTSQVDINGTVKITGGSPGAGKILKSDANGLASWVDGATVNGGGWTVSGTSTSMSAGNVGIGTATPSASLHVAGSLKYEDSNQGDGKVLTSDANGLASWQTPATGATELDDLSDAVSDGAITLFVGTGAGASNTSSAIYNTATGLNALNTNTAGSFNTAFGFEALKNNTASSNTAMGYNALKANTTGGANFAGGTSSLESNIGGSNNTATGTASLTSNTSGNDNSSYGYQSMNANVGGIDNTAIGSGSLKSNTSANNNVAIGFEALNTNSTGANNTAIGTNAGHNATGTGCVFIGFNAGFGETGDNKLYIDNTNNNIPLIGGDFSSNQVDINGTIKITGGSPGLNKVLTSDADGLASWQTVSSTGATQINELSDAIYDGSSLFMGEQAGDNDDGTTNQNTGVGKNALRFNTSGNTNSAFGYLAMYANSGGNSNTAMGNQALRLNSTGSYNAAYGASSLFSNTGDQNSAFGFNALNLNTSGQENVAIGSFSIGSNTTGNGNLAAGNGSLSALGSGDYNIGLGYGAGVYLSDGTTPFTSGTHNIFIGYFTKSLNDADTNQIVIGNLVSGLGNNSVVLGNSDITKTALYGKVGIGTTAPKSTLQVNGGVQMADDTDVASADKAGTIRYRADSNNSYVEMCVQTGTSTYAWVVIHQETW